MRTTDTFGSIICKVSRSFLFYRIKKVSVRIGGFTFPAGVCLMTRRLRGLLIMIEMEGTGAVEKSMLFVKSELVNSQLNNDIKNLKWTFLYEEIKEID